MDSNTSFKLKKILDKLLEPNFKPRNETHLDSLVAFLTKENEFVPGCWQNDIRNYLSKTWLKTAISKWKLHGVPPNPSVLKFAMNIIIWMCGRKQTFELLLEDNLLLNSISILFKFIDFGMGEEYDVFVKLVSSMADYESSLQILLYPRYWNTIMRLGIAYSSRNMSTSTSKCVAKIVRKSASLDEFSSKSIVYEMVWPFIGASDRKSEFVEPIRTVANHELIFLSLHFIVDVLENLLEYQITMNKQEIFGLSTERNHMVKYVHRMLKTHTNDELIQDLCKVLVILCFADIHIGMNDKNGKYHTMKNLPRKIFKLLYDIDSNVSLKNTLNLINTCVTYWDILHKKLPDILKTEYKISLSPKCQLAFLLAYNATINRFRTFNLALSKYVEEDSLRFQYSKVSKSILPEVRRMFYKWKDNSNQYLGFSQGILTLQHLIKSIKQYNTVQAICIFQFLIYNFKDICQIMKTRTNLVTSLFNQPEYMTILFQCITAFIEYLPYSWYHSVEALNILDFIYDFLVFLDWPADIVVDALRLADKAIWNCMSPQMILLMNEDDNYSLKPFAPMLRTNLRNTNWKIRESSVSLIATISANAIARYPSFRNWLSENEFPSLVLDVAFHDNNPFVRKAALRCLQQTIQLRECWYTLFNNNILASTLNMFKVEPDSNVRAEAVHLLKSIYEHQELSEDMRNTFYDILAHVALKDSDVAVKIQSLHFWQSVINRELTERGMVDGEFPSTLFAKKNRKIVHLDRKTVKNILIEVLYQLAVHNCLLVFYEALQNDTNSEVYECAKILISDFGTLLGNYEITSTDFTPTRSMSTTAPISYVNDLDLGVIIPSNSSIFDECIDYSFLDEFDDIFGGNENNVLPIITSNSTKTMYLNPVQFMTCISTKFLINDEVTKEVDHFQLLLDEMFENI
ncbi:integrator complex assembly factor Brat1 [Leptinotarsa decemlineata]|uniref:integrator complex assembly factor Brat1 n=1 Tax=Leptinotarsa decemlineata TaxID=7539 RepID=UPI000C254CCC|nr:uncharacterized protein LOC111507428 [Leptinotarsa decemlineata]XP_023018491.1 uncharacterized protein LOC111507428 [Leptinotarsa decemlineata]